MVQQFYQQALAPLTLRSYTSAHSRYLSFCSLYHLSPLPITEATLCKFVAAMAQQGVSHSSIKAYLSAICFMQLSHLGRDPGISDMMYLSYVLQGIKRSQAIGSSSTPHQHLSHHKSCANSRSLGNHGAFLSTRLCCGRHLAPASSGSYDLGKLLSQASPRTTPQFTSLLMTSS